MWAYTDVAYQDTACVGMACAVAANIVMASMPRGGFAVPRSLIKKNRKKGGAPVEHSDERETECALQLAVVPVRGARPRFFVQLFRRRADG